MAGIYLPWGSLNRQIRTAFHVDMPTTNLGLFLGVIVPTNGMVGREGASPASSRALTCLLLVDKLSGSMSQKDKPQNS